MTLMNAATLVEARTPQADLTTKLFVVEQLVSGKSYLCNLCGFLIESGKPCEVCTEDDWADAQFTLIDGAEGPFGCDPFAEF